MSERVGVVNIAIEGQLLTGAFLAAVFRTERVLHLLFVPVGEHDDPVSHLRLVRMHGRENPTRTQLAQDLSYRDAVRAVTGIA